MAERNKRYINKVLRLVRAIREEARVDPKDIYSMTVESTSDWAKFRESEEYRVKIATTYIWGGALRVFIVRERNTAMIHAKTSVCKITASVSTNLPHFSRPLAAYRNLL